MSAAAGFARHQGLIRAGRHAGLAAVALISTSLANPARAADPRLAIPLDCVLGDTCFIQNHVDADPGPVGSDFTCGPLSYDGHKGTDFALTSMAAMEAGVTVRASAGGVVRAVRDGMPDTGLAGTPAAVLEGKDCGNGVVIDHGDGWETQYCHLKAGSLSASKGERVVAGAALGEVGLSGRTEFPHLHISVRQDGMVVDPFDTDGEHTCGLDDGPDDDLWIEPMPYVAGGLVTAGIASAVPEFEDVKSGAAVRATLPGDSPALVGWAQVFGGRVGDGVEIALTDPSGVLFYSHTATLEKAQARLFRAAGKKTPASGWMPGDWIVTARLLRGGTVLDEIVANVRVGD